MRASRFRALEILDVLNSFYSLRKLEELLGIPYQTLWKYVNLLTVPEEKTAEKILGNVRKHRLIEKTIRASFSNLGGDIYYLSRNPGFLKLFSMLVENIVRDRKISYVYSASTEALPLASVAALKLGFEVCPVTGFAKCEKKSYATTYYYSRRYGEVRFVIVPKNCLQTGKNAIIVDVVVDDVDKLLALKTLMTKFKVKPSLLIALHSHYSIEELEKLELGKIEVVFTPQEQQ